MGEYDEGELRRTGNREQRTENREQRSLAIGTRLLSPATERRPWFTIHEPRATNCELRTVN